MKEFLFTLKFVLKQSMTLSQVFYKLREDKRYRNMFIFVCITLLLCMSSYVGFITLFIKLFQQFRQAGLQTLFLVMAIFLSAFVIVFFGMFQIMGFFYFSDDIRIFAPLPLKPRNYLISKFIVIYIWELITSLFVILPFFIIYGVYMKIGLINWISMLLNFAFLPVVPLVVVGIFTVILMRLTSFYKNKDAVRLFGYLLLIFGILGLEYSFLSSVLTMPKDKAGQIAFLQNILTNATYFLSRFEKFYPITGFIKYSVAGTAFQAILSVVGFAVVSILSIYLFSFVLQKIFIESYLREQNNNTIKKRNIKITDRTYQYKKPWIGIAKIDFNTLLRVPMYLLNTLSLLIIIPLLLIGYASLGRLAIPDNEMSKLLELYDVNKGVFWLGIALFLAVFAALNPVGSTTFSREGKTSWIMRTLPVSSKDHIFGRFFTAFIMELILGIIVNGMFVYIVSTKDTLLINILYAAAALILGLISASALILTGIYIDLKRPMLKWENPQQPVKQNMNVLISLGIGMVYGTAMFLIYKLLISFMPLPLVTAVFGIINIFYVYIIYDILNSQFEQSLVTME